VETPKAPDATHGEMTHIGKSVVIKGELSCSEELYIDGQVEGAIDPKGNRLTIRPGVLKPVSRPARWGWRGNWKAISVQATGST
jgi:hypothetical protein